MVALKKFQDFLASLGKGDSYTNHNESIGWSTLGLVHSQTGIRAAG